MTIIIGGRIILSKNRLIPNAFKIVSFFLILPNDELNYLRRGKICNFNLN